MERKRKRFEKRENVQTHTMIPTLTRAYTYAKLRAMGSFDALKSATASVPIKTDILIYDTHA